MTLDPKVTQQLERHGRAVEREVGRADVSAILGNGQGVVLLEGKSSYYYYRQVSTNSAGDTVYSAPSIALASGATIPEEEGVAVRITFWGRIPIVAGIDPLRYADSGKTAAGLNPLSPYNKFLLMRYALLGYATPVGTTGTPTLEVYVEPFNYIDDLGNYKTNGGVQVDLASKVPAADGDGNDQQLICALFVSRANVMTLVTSTPKLASDTLTHETDIAEVFASAPPRAMPLRAWKLYTGQTLLSIGDEFCDIRRWLDSIDRKNNYSASIAPTVNDDVDLNYEVGSEWIDTTADRFYKNLDETDGAAVWQTYLKHNPVTSIPEIIKAIIFNTSPGAVSEVAGMIYWNEDEYTVNIVTGLGPVLQIGQEVYILFYNDTGAQIDNLTALRPKAAAVVGSIVLPTFEKASSGPDFNEVEGTIAVATMNVPNGQVGLATRFGRARGGNTSSFTPGDALFLSSTPGVLTNVFPPFPEYVISVGGVVVSDASDGEIFVSVTRDIFDTTLNFWNGTFREQFDFRVTSNGTIITGTLTPSNGHPDMTMIFSDGLEMLDTTPGATITLTAGTDTVPQINYVYIPQSTKVLTVDTDSWPTTVEHIRVAEILLVSAATTQLEGGARRNQNWNDEIQDTSSSQGHNAHIGEWIRTQPSLHVPNTGSAATLTGTPTNVYITSDPGDVMQFHRAAMPKQDMTQYTIDAVSTGSDTITISGDGDLSTIFPVGRSFSISDSTGNDGQYTVGSILWSSPDFTITVEEDITDATADGTAGNFIIVINDSVTALKKVTNLNYITIDSEGATLNNKWFNLVIWGVRNKSGELSYLCCNLPRGSYSSEEAAITDGLQYSNYTIPSAYNGVGFLIARFTLRKSSSNFTYNGGTAYLDLRGTFPSVAAGGGGGGVTQFIGLSDTPSLYTGAASQLAAVNSAETALEFINTITAPSAATTPLALKAAVSQTAPGFELQNSAGTPQLQIAANMRDFVLDTTTGTKIGTATSQKLGFFNATPVVQPTEITDELTTITFSAPGTPDYAIQDLTQTTPYGFVTSDEAQTLLSVVANLQARVNELETVLSTLGLVADAD
jgi:hypothetical protein